MNLHSFVHLPVLMDKLILILLYTHALYPNYYSLDIMHECIIRLLSYPEWQLQTFRNKYKYNNYSRILYTMQPIVQSSTFTLQLIGLIQYNTKETYFHIEMCSHINYHNHTNSISFICNLYCDTLECTLLRALVIQDRVWFILKVQCKMHIYLWRLRRHIQSQIDSHIHFQHTLPIIENYYGPY